MDNKLNDGYYREITKNLPNGSSILVVIFAREEKEYDEIMERERKKILSSTDKKHFEVLLASQDKFIEQVENADALVIIGGDTQKLIEALNQHPKFSNALKGKIVAGSSAGACVFAKYYHSADSGKVFEGLGTLPLRLICHFKTTSDEFAVTDKAITAMDNYPNDLELVVLKDYEWRIFTR